VAGGWVVAVPEETKSKAPVFLLFVRFPFEIYGDLPQLVSVLGTWACLCAFEIGIKNHASFGRGVQSDALPAVRLTCERHPVPNSVTYRN